MNVSIGLCRFAVRKRDLDRSDGVDSEGEVDVWLRHVSRQWSGQCGWLATRRSGHGSGSRDSLYNDKHFEDKATNNLCKSSCTKSSKKSMKT